MDKMIEYRRRVERLAQERSGEPIANGSVDHAAIIIENMFKSAKQQVSILSGNLNARAYGRDEVLEEATLFLAHGAHKARILLEDVDETMLKDHPFIERLGHNENVEIRRVPATVRNSYNYHFLVMDDDSYRFEPKKDEPAAVGVFGNRDGAAHLSGIFNILWDVSEQIHMRSKERAQTA